MPQIPENRIICGRALPEQPLQKTVLAISNKTLYKAKGGSLNARKQDHNF